MGQNRASNTSQSASPSKPTGLRARGNSVPAVMAALAEGESKADLQPAPDTHSISREEKLTQPSPTRVPKHLQKSPFKSRKNRDKDLPAMPPARSQETQTPPPELPFTWKYAVGGSSSFERALDAVMDRLDNMEGKVQSDGRTEPPRRLATSSRDSCEAPASDPKHRSTSTPRSDAAKAAKSLSLDQAEQSVDYLDRDITDRDVLKGLKMAICAACDEDLDAWIRCKTGLRLRRFLADLRAFEDLEEERTKAKEVERRSRQLRTGKGRLEAEVERRRRNTTSTTQENDNQI